MGVGRDEASLGPALAGILFANGFALPLLGLIMCAGSVLSFAIIFFRDRRSQSE